MSPRTGVEPAVTRRPDDERPGDAIGKRICYGKTHSNPVIVTINAQPKKGLLGQLLCGLAGGGGITNLAGLPSLLNSLGLNLSTTQLQTLLNQLGITRRAG